MNKIALLICLAWSAVAFGQRHVDSDWKKEVNSVFSGLDLSRVPNKVLLDYALEFTNVPAYNGTITDSTAIDVNIFSDIYRTLYMGRTVADSIRFPKLEKIAHNWVEERLKVASSHNTIALAGLYYKYSRIKSTALQDKKINVVNSTSYADKFVNGVWQNPYETLSTIAFAPPVSSFNKKTFKVVLPEVMMLSNGLGDIEKIELDGQDGNGYKDLRYGQPVTLNYPKKGTYRWTYRITLRDHTVLYAYTVFSVLDEPLADETIEEVSGATLQIDYAPGHGGHLRRPFLVVEGFDTGHISKPEVFGGDINKDDFVQSIQGSGDFDDLLDDNGTQQYDLIYLDWEEGTIDLRENSKVLEDVINWINDNKIGDEDIVIMGQSMGGVITRYTLAKMENDTNASPHHVRLYISHDAPHQGSNTLLSGQMFIRHLYNEYLETPIGALAEDVVPAIFTLADLMTDLLNEYTGTSLSVDTYVSPGDVLTLQDTPAAVQMNYYWFTPNEVVVNNIHEEWQEELELMGYPEDSHNIAISNGNECGNNQGFYPGAVLADIHSDKPHGFFRSLLWGLATPLVGVATGDLDLIVLGLLPGSSRYYFDFELKALPAVGVTNRNIYNGKIRYRKKFLWVTFNIWHTMTERSKSAPTYTIPFDSYSGGNFDISDYSDDIPNIFPDFTFHHPTYDFIPTVSALDVKRNTVQPTAPADYMRVYAGNEMPDAGLATSFDNFLVESRFNAPFNNEHITFQLRTGNWLAEELAETPNNIADCSYICDADQITGPDVICGTSGTYSMPAGFDSYYWWIDDDHDYLFTMTGQGTNTITISSTNYGGSFTLFVATNSTCGGGVISKEIYIGSPVPNIVGINCVTTSAPCYITTAPANNYWTFTLTAPEGSYDPSTVVWQWEKIGGNFSFLSGGSYGSDTATGLTANIYISGPNYTSKPLSFRVRMITECGESAWRTYTWSDGTTEPTPGNNEQFTFSPNPADGFVTVTAVNPNQYPGGTALTVKMFTIPPIGQPVIPQYTLYTSVGYVVLPTTGVPDGAYAVIVYNGSTSIGGTTVLIEH